jgi:cysteine desulfurase / selenocysteine lyase
LKVSAITAGNNITGTLVDVDRLAVLCHKYGTLACFDYAAVVPYVPVNMQGVTPDLA